MRVRLPNVLSNAGNILLYGLGIAILVQNYHLHKTVDQLNNPRPGVMIGAELKHISGATIDGKVRELTRNEMSRTLLVTLSPGCGFCADQQVKWSAVAQRVRSTPGWHVLWISGDTSDSTRSYCEKYSIPFSEVISDPTYRTYLQLNMKSVPTTIVLKDGVVVKQWFGSLKDNDWATLNSLIA